LSYLNALMKLSEKTTRAIEAIRPLLSGSQRALLTVHRDPDMDAIGSALAWAEVLRHFGVQVDVWAADPLDEYLMVLPGAHDVISILDLTLPYDAVWILDSASFERVRHSEQLLPLQGRIPFINIDHHADNTLFGDHLMVQTVSSVGEFLYWIIQYLGVPITLEMATCLYAAICFDTGRFLYSNTEASTFQAAAGLVACGVDPGRLGVLLFESMPVVAFYVLQLALSRMVVDSKLGLVYTSLPKEAPEEVIKVVDFIRQIREAQVIVVFREQANGSVRVNLRSKGDTIVNTIAHQFGGGGHPKAAGVMMDGPLDYAITQVIEVVRATLGGR